MPYYRLWLEWLSSQGYDNFWQVLNAKDYGVPQNRERVFCVSTLGGEWFNFPAPVPLERDLKDILEDDVDESYYFNDGKVLRFIGQLPDDTLKKYGITIPEGVRESLCNGEA